METKSPSLQFIKVQNPSDLIPILRSRHPHSCFMQNAVQTYEGFKDYLFFYTVGTEITESTWIVCNHVLEDYGSHINISAPVAITKGDEEVGQDIRDVFANGGNAIKWEEYVVFLALEKALSKMIMDVSINVLGNVTEVHPCSLYYMGIPDALQLEIKARPRVEVRQLDAKNQEEDFILAGWAHSRPGSEIAIRRNIQKNVSGGVFLDGKCVSGVNIPGYGLLSALYTGKSHRKKGYGKLTMKYACKEYARKGCTPCWTVEQRNTSSIKFYESIGAKRLAVVDRVEVKPLEVD